MIGQKSVIAIIPARGGSKGLPGKNIRQLCGKPLLAWSVESALQCPYIDETLVTTDSEEIAEVARRFGASVPFLRPAEFASDTATSFSAVKHALEFYRANGRTFVIVALLEPTSPLRAQDDIGRMLEKLVAMYERYDAIISLGEVREHPSITKKLCGDSIEPYYKHLEQKSRRQDQETAYFPFGVAYIVKTSVLLHEETFYPRRSTYHKLQRYQCYEIDDAYDFMVIEKLMHHQLADKCARS